MEQESKQCDLVLVLWFQQDPRQQDVGGIVHNLDCIWLEAVLCLRPQVAVVVSCAVVCQRGRGEELRTQPCGEPVFRVI